jgi:ureidoacrylate peracid hydrolase
MESTTRRNFLRLFSAGTTGAFLAACAAQASATPTTARPAAESELTEAAKPGARRLTAMPARHPQDQATTSERQEGAMRSPDTRITVEAKPAPLTIDPAESAVIVVDMQNDFGAEGGMFALAGIDISDIRAAIAPTARVLTAARRAGMAVVYLKMGFRPDLSDAGAPDAPNWLKHLPLRAGEAATAPDGTASQILIRDTWNTDIVPELTPEPGDLVFYKHRFSGFYGTELESALRGRSVRNLVFAGCTTSVCVESTIRDAMFRDFTCLLLADCAAEPIGAGLPRSNHDASLLVIQLLFGWVGGSDEFISALQSR